MPLKQSSSKEALHENIATEVRAGKDPKQAAAIGYSVQRQNKDEAMAETVTVGPQSIAEIQKQNEAMWRPDPAGSQRGTIKTGIGEPFPSSGNSGSVMGGPVKVYDGAFAPQNNKSFPEPKMKDVGAVSFGPGGKSSGYEINTADDGATTEGDLEVKIPEGATDSRDDGNDVMPDIPKGATDARGRDYGPGQNPASHGKGGGSGASGENSYEEAYHKMSPSEKEEFHGTYMGKAMQERHALKGTYMGQARYGKSHGPGGDSRKKG